MLFHTRNELFLYLLYMYKVSINKIAWDNRNKYIIFI